MAKDKITEYDATANNNTVCGDVNIAENSALPSDMNNFAREIMSHLKEGLGSGTPLYVDQTNNRLGINSSSPATALDVTGTVTASAINVAGASGAEITITDNSPSTVSLFMGAGNSSVSMGSTTSDPVTFLTANSERMRIDSSGRVMIGTTTEGASNEAEELTIAGTGGVGMTIRSTDSGTSRIYFSDGTSGTSEYAGYQIYNHSSNAMIFGTNAIERMRIDSSGNLNIGTTSTFNSSYVGIEFNGTTHNGIVLKTTRTTQTGSNYLYFVGSTGTNTGEIQQISTNQVNYSTTSDYRLKENVTADWDATTRLKQLNPVRFNFIADGADRVVDGFLAHEVQSVVPEAITGEKDAVDADGNPKYQGIDQSRLVPLLVKTIQELEARIVALETA